MQPTKVDRDSVRSEWSARGYSCELWIDPPDQIWHDVQHDVDGILLLLEGQCQVEMEGRTVRMQSGDELQLPAGMRHTVRNCGAGPARWLHGFRQGA
jgi:mannose-6-phosphate isomerase-like protein (cupin superfamily)